MTMPRPGRYWAIRRRMWSIARLCVIEADPLPELKPGQGFWINHVHAVKDQEKFMAYAGQSIPLFSSATMGPVVHQHVGAGATSYTVAFAALFGLESAQAGLEMAASDAHRPQRRREG